MHANDLFNAVMQLDLEPIKMKLMHVESGEGWSPDKANAVEMEYRRFLCLMTMYPNEAIAPLVDVDTFWHYHILDTMKYAIDCEQAFGYFVHHYPYVGLRGGDDEQFRLDSGDRMRELYEATFGEAYPVTGATPVEQADAPAYCAGPWDKPGARGGAPLRISAAYCAGPWDKQGAPAAAPTATAYCAGPWDQTDARAAGRTDTAYCAGPWDKPHAHGAAGAATAYCVGPWDKQGVRAAAKAETAYCAGPWDKHEIRAANTAYCAGPWAPSITPAALNV